MDWFDPNVLAHDLFEEKHHLFESLMKRQLEWISPTRPRRILDVGCGTGTSSRTLYHSLSPEVPPSIFAIDINEQMLNRAKDRCKDIPGVYFVNVDTENLESFFREGFDAVFLSPSVFLLPKYRDSIRQSCNLLVPDGVLSLCYYDGLFTEEGEDAILKAFPDTRYRPGTAPFSDLESCLDSLSDFRKTLVDFQFEAGRDFLFDFLSIPSQSASLFPKVPYLDRIPMVRELCSLLEEKAGRVFMGWKFCIARKTQRLAS